MGAVNWSEFQKLPGSQEGNFETLCRSLIRLNFGRYGQFLATANQPGVEFHLQLKSACPVGMAGEWHGWQCRWYRLSSGQALGNARRAKIEKSLRTTERVLPQLTHWVLWTRHPLTAGDQKWFLGLRATYQLRLSTAEDAEILLAGDAAILRSTYFGEWVLRPVDLELLHAKAVASIRARWLPAAHQEVDGERKIRRMLGQVTSWDQLTVVAARLNAAARLIQPNGRFSAALTPRITRFLQALRTLSAALEAAPSLLAAGDFELLRQTLESRPALPDRDIAGVPRALRVIRSTVGFEATNALADLRLGVKLLQEMDYCLGTRLVAVLADAGGGKTQLAAQLTATISDRPAGILLHGRKLRAGQSLDNLANGMSFQGRSFPSIEALIAAVDAAGQRARRRLPVVVDGLNEAEDPRDWKISLAELEPILRANPNVLFVVTLRTGARRPAEQHWEHRFNAESTERTLFAEMALPENIPQLEMRGFGEDNSAAIARYFRIYRINATGADAPSDLLDDPLTLRLFCEVTNPTPEKGAVGADAMPHSLAALFERYLGVTAARIAELSQAHRFYAKEVRSAMAILGNSLWLNNARELAETEFRKQIGDDQRDWHKSLLPLLEQEGLLLRVEGRNVTESNIIPIYDALGGYIIAQSLLTQMGRTGFVEWIKNPQNLARFTGKPEDIHPLASDIFQALVVLVPKQLGSDQLWTFLEGELRRAALSATTKLEASLLDTETIAALDEIVRDPEASTGIFVRLARTRALPNHPLNAEFLDSALRRMTNAERDLRWTEWLRGVYRESKNLNSLGETWRTQPTVRSSSERLRARWYMWFLTTTAHELRNKVTRALYWFGRSDPEFFFSLAIESLAITDPYVPERMLAASYGVAMALHTSNNPADSQEKSLPAFARKLYDAIFKEKAPYPTTHLLAREYARRIIEFAARGKKHLFTSDERLRARPPYSPDLHRTWKEIQSDKEEIHGLDSPFRMDFENYTLGRLVSDRHNYDFKNPIYRKIRGQILWRITELGWSNDQFRGIDESIARMEDFPRVATTDRKVDRYGKKYSLIAYYEMAGARYDLGLLAREAPDNRCWDVDLDPSFPSPPTVEAIVAKDFLGSPRITTRDWIENGAIPDVRPLLQRKTIAGQAGPWILLDSYITQADKIRGRDLFCFVRSFLVPTKDAGAVVKALRRQSMKGRWLPEKRAFGYAYAGEFPWCGTYEENGKTILRFVVERRIVKVKRLRSVVVIDGETFVVPLFPRSGKYSKYSAAIRSGIPVAAVAKAKPRRKLVEVEEIQERTIEFKVRIPVAEYSWEGPTIDDISLHSGILAKEVAAHLQLVGIPQTLDLMTGAGMRVTFNVAGGTEARENRQKFFYMRRSVLSAYLRRKRLALILVTWGERGLSLNLAADPKFDREKEGPGFKVFHTVRLFPLKD